MSFSYKILEAFMVQAQIPKLFGLLHIFAIVAVIATTFLLCKFFSKSDDKVYRRITLIFWIIIVVFETYKQIIFSAYLDSQTGTITWVYCWDRFPFQLCSTPLYVWPLIALLKDSKVRNALLAFNMTFVLFGGLTVLVYPGDVFEAMVGRNIQTLVHHGLQIVSGIFTFAFYRKKVNFKFFLSGIIVFAIALVMALIMNAIANKTHPEHWFNMFYLSPDFGCPLVILGELYGTSLEKRRVAYPIFLMLYTFGFVIVAYLMYIIQIGVHKLISKFSKGSKDAIKE